MAKKTKIKAEEIGEEKIIPSEVAAEKKDHAIFEPEGELVADVFETDNHFVVMATIAGVNIKDLDISVEKEMMVIKGNRVNPHQDTERKFFYQECYWGPFSRKVILPENINTEATLAEIDKGILMIKIPWNKEETPEAKTA